jgi:inner membrane protein
MWTGGIFSTPSLNLGNALHIRPRGLAMAAVFAPLYGLLYLILRLQDDALLAGALLGFAAPTTVMFATLRVDWSGGQGRAPATPTPASP